MKFRKRPVVIEAEQVPWQADDTAQWERLSAHMGRRVGPELPQIVDTLEGTLVDSAPGDWIIRGVSGELYPCKPDIFARTYDAVPEGEAD